MTNTEKQELRRLCKAGYSFDQIRSKLDCHDATIRRYMKVFSVTNTSKKDDALKILPKYLTIIESDLMKVAHYLKVGVKVAIVAEDKELSEKLAEHYIVADELTKDFMKLTRRIVD